MLGPGLLSADPGPAVSRRKRAVRASVPDTCERAVQGRKSLCEPLRVIQEAEKGSLQTLESPTVFANR